MKRWDGDESHSFLFGEELGPSFAQLGSEEPRNEVEGFLLRITVEGEVPETRKAGRRSIIKLLIIIFTFIFFILCYLS